jgi:tRNA nucleotidyltransferase (CCA-adding enzyme)
MKIYLVGGAVRDKLLGLPVKERDWVVVGATPDEMIRLGYTPVGKDFPVFLHPQTGEEYALARTERKHGHGYTGFVVHASPEVTLEDDLRRRDLTINAMAEAADGELIDPFHGQADLDAGLLRHVSPAFVEDPVRILRVARFAARFAKWGFRVAHGTHALMKRMVANGEVDHLVPERVWSETVRGLGETAPVRFFEVLRRCGALLRLFPEIERLYGATQPPADHAETDSGVHAMRVLAQAVKLTPDPVVRFAALVHDLGEAQTPHAELPRHAGHEARSIALIEALCARLRVPNAFRELALLVAHHYTHCHHALELDAATVLDTLQAVDAFRRPDRFEKFLLACEADSRGRRGFEDQPYPQADYLRGARDSAAAVAASAFSGSGLSGQEIGARLRSKRTKAIENFRRRRS